MQRTPEILGQIQTIYSEFKFVSLFMLFDIRWVEVCALSNALIFVCFFVYLFVSRITQKRAESLCTKLVGEIGHWSGKN